MRVLLLAALCATAFADVLFTSPAAGDVVSSPYISIAWNDSGIAPPVSDLVSYQIFLCAGGNNATNYIQIATIAPSGLFADGNYVTGVINTGLGADVTNAWFLKIISAATGGTVINFSNRFSISGMNGTFLPAVMVGIATVEGTAGPATENEINGTSATTTTITSVPASSVSSMSTMRSSPASTKTPTSQASGLSAGAGAGIGIAGLVALATLASGIFFAIRARKRSRRLQNHVRGSDMIAELKPQLEDTSVRPEKAVHEMNARDNEVHEVDGVEYASRGPPRELRAGHYSNRHELDGRRL